MVRYKRYRRRRYGRSTNVVKMKIQSFMDISTSDSSMQVISVSVGGIDLFRRLVAQFGAYKYYKLGNISVKLVPASTLPVDPTGLSYEAGQATVDPRDQLTPGLMRITNGEDVLDSVSGIDSTTQHNIYNNMLLDPRWFKWMLQTGVKRHATPRYWQIGQFHQDKWPGAIINTPFVSTAGQSTAPTTCTQKGVSVSGVSGISYSGVGNASSPYGFFQTGHRGVLGWLPTDGLQVVNDGSTVEQQPYMSAPPEVEVMKIILPKAYKTKYYYRMFITETVYFKEPLVTCGIVEAGGAGYRPLDVFHIQYAPVPEAPVTSHNPVTASNYRQYTGGNDGSN